MALLALLLVSILAACQPEDKAAGPPDLSGFDPERFEREKAACERRGGWVARGGLAGTHVCFEKTRDAGKACREADDCEGLCLARSRSCAPIRPLFGCHEILAENGMPVTLCID